MHLYPLVTEFLHKSNYYMHCGMLSVSVCPIHLITQFHFAIYLHISIKNLAPHSLCASISVIKTRQLTVNRLSRSGANKKKTEKHLANAPDWTFNLKGQKGAEKNHTEAKKQNVGNKAKCIFLMKFDTCAGRVQRAAGEVKWESSRVSVAGRS